MDYTYIPYYSLKPNAITLFEKPEERIISIRQRETFNNLKDNTNKYGEISEHAQKRLRKMIDFMLYITREKQLNAHRIKTKSIGDEIFIEKGTKYKSNVKYKLTFTTLTLPAPQVHSDEHIKKEALNHFLTELRRKFKSEIYIWKAEKQENGNIHFHILCDKYIHHSELRDTWNRIINKPSLGYVDRYSERMKAIFANGFVMLPGDRRSREKQLKAYEYNSAIDWTSPNSTDIHALHRVKNVSAYIAKYISKDVTRTKRVERMTAIDFRLEQVTYQLEMLQYDKLLQAESSLRNTYIIDLQTEKQALTDEYAALAAKGVQGRIWGCSQRLSRCKSFVEVSSFDAVPDISIIEQNAIYKKVVEVGSSSILTYVFDIQKTPNLKCLLDTHLAQTVKDQLL